MLYKCKMVIGETKSEEYGGFLCYLFNLSVDLKLFFKIKTVLRQKAFLKLCNFCNYELLHILDWNVPMNQTTDLM